MKRTLVNKSLSSSCYSIFTPILSSHLRHFHFPFISVLTLIFLFSLLIPQRGLTTLQSSYLAPKESSKDLTQRQPISLIGVWEYIGYIYQDNFYPPQDPELTMRFAFENFRHVRLSWESSGGAIRCARLAEYETSSNTLLKQKNIWIDPQNHSSCGGDKDMVMGYESYSYFQVLEGIVIHPDLKDRRSIFQLEVGISEESLFMLFEREGPSSPEYP